MAKDEVEGIEGVKLLTSSSFRTWDLEIGLYLESKGLKGFLNNTEVKPTIPTELKDWDELTLDEKVTWANKRGQVISDNNGTNNALLAACEPLYCKEQDRIATRATVARENLKEYEKKYAKTRQVLYQSISRSLRPGIPTIKEPHKIYATLKKDLNKKTKTTNIILREQLTVPWQWGSIESWDAYLANFIDIIAQLKENGATIEAEEANNLLKKNVPQEELAVYLDLLEEKLEDKDYTIEEFIAKVRLDVMKRITKAEAKSTAYKSTQQNHHQSKRNITCSHCHRARHSDTECWDKHPHLLPKQLPPCQPKKDNQKEDGKVAELQKKIAAL